MKEKTITTLFMAVGLIVLTGVAIFAAKRYQFIQHAQQTDGVVVAVYSGKFHPEFEFGTPTGERIRFIQNGFHKGYGEGETAVVLYDAANPRNAVVNSFGALWAIHLIFGLMGLVFLALGWIKRKYPNAQWLRFRYDKQ